MSWSASVPSTPAADFPAAIYAAVPGGTPPFLPEVIEQLDAAKAAAEAIFESGAVGDSTHSYAVSMSGHANTGHGPAPGWANDQVSITISQQKPSA